MTRFPRYRLLTVVLAGLLAGAVVPYALHAQDTSGQTSSSSSKAAKKHLWKHKKAAEKKAAEAKTTEAKKESKASKWMHKKNEEAAKSGEAAKTKSMVATHEAMTSQNPPSQGMVWVNTGSKVYHKSGSRWYGKTKHGKWMSEADAQKAGYKAAKN